MWNVCQNCGEYRADKEIDASGSYAICPECRHRHPFRQTALLIVCGPSGTGKTAICSELMGEVDEVILLEGDIIWQPEFSNADDNYRTFFNTWLRLGKNIGQAGRPVVLFSAGAVPANIEPCVERRYFSRVHYLALVCDDETLSARLRARPSWRQSRDESYIEGQIAYAQSLRQMASETDSQIELVDTSENTVVKTASEVAGWIRSRV